MKTLFRSYNTKIHSTYVISIKNHRTSEFYTNRCVQSLQTVGMNYTIWEAYDGTQSGPIIPPQHLKDCSFMNILKIMDNYLSKSEVACALSHISLWLECAKIDAPIIILEHDAVMLKPLHEFVGFNTILHLGSVEWAEMGWPISHIPLHASDGPNKHFICRAHAYAIDPIVAKNLLAQVLKMGIYKSLDEMMYADLFNISHVGCLAYDKPSESTIKNRPVHHRRIEKNDSLLY